MSVPAWDRNSRGFGAWTEWLSLVAGLALVWLSISEPRLAQGTLRFTAPAFLGLGLLLAAFGLRTLGARVFSWVGGLNAKGARRYRVHVQREALVYMLILMVLCLGALLGHNNMLMLVFGLMAGPFVLGGQVTRMILNRLHVERALPDHAVAGQSFAVRLRLDNRKPFLSAWMVTAADKLAGHREEHHPAVLFTRVPPYGEREAAYTVRPAHRGIYRFGPVRVGCSFPLGLVERSYEVGGEQELLVLPRVGRLTEHWREKLREGAQSSESAPSRMGLYDDEFDRLREYRSGDNPRAIHWRTTARRNELMVREFKHHRVPDLTVVLDLWQPDRPAPADLERVELAVSFVATLCVDQSRLAADSTIRLTIRGEQPFSVEVSGHPASLRSALEALAQARGGKTPAVAETLAEVAPSADPRSLRILVSTRTGEAIRETRRSYDPATEAFRESLPQFRVLSADPEELAPYLLLQDEPGEGAA